LSTTPINDLRPGDYIGISEFDSLGKCIGLYVISIQTHEIHLIAPDLCDVSPSPSLTHLASDEGPGFKIAEINDGMVKTTRIISDCSNPSWSPSGSMVACDDMDANIRIVDISTGAFSILTNCDFRSGLPCAFPIWSPDGEQIAFQRACGRGGGCGEISPGPGLYLLHLDCPVVSSACTGTESGPLPTLYPESCKWSSDAKYIACNGVSGIEVVDVLSGDVTIIEQGNCESGSIAWHPTTEVIACISRHSDLDSEGAIRILEIQGGSQEIPIEVSLFQIDFWTRIP
jgi:hypothetical protein